MDETKKESKLDVLKQAITDFVNVEVNDLRDSENKAKFIDAFKTVLKSEDSGVYAWLEEVLPFMKEKADEKGITLNSKDEYEAEPEDETPAEEAQTEETPTDETPAEEVKAESYKSKNSLLVEMANLYVD